jgi:Metal binding domain of Ada
MNRRRTTIAAIVIALAATYWITRSPSVQTVPVAQAAYVASRDRDSFHRASCGSGRRIKEQNKVGYASRADAVADGHRPCKVCKP